MESAEKKEFVGKTAIVTGAASGMGLLSARKLAEGGANVVLCDVNGERVEAAAAEIRQNGGNSFAVKVDVRHYEEVEAAAKFTLEHCGRIDILINCAGGYCGRIFNRGSEPFWELPTEVLDWGAEVNFKGPIWFCRAVFGTMLKQENGVIINLGSIDGVTGGWGVVYGAAKAGMVGLTRSLAIFGAPHKVRVCCVTPGPVLTRPGMAKMATLLKRAAEPIEVVNLILYLCSDKAAFITGCNYLIDGGRSCGGACYIDNGKK